MRVLIEETLNGWLVSVVDTLELGVKKWVFGANKYDEIATFVRNMLFLGYTNGETRERKEDEKQ